MAGTGIYGLVSGRQRTTRYGMAIWRGVTLPFALPHSLTMTVFDHGPLACGGHFILLHALVKQGPQKLGVILVAYSIPQENRHLIPYLCAFAHLFGAGIHEMLNVL